MRTQVEVVCHTEHIVSTEVELHSVVGALLVIVHTILVSNAPEIRWLALESSLVAPPLRIMLHIVVAVDGQQIHACDIDREECIDIATLEKRVGTVP